MSRPSNALIFRITCIALLWLFLCWLLLKTAPFDMQTLFVIVASGIVVFVPLYKKHFRKENGNETH